MFNTAVSASTGVVVGSQQNVTLNLNVGIDPAALREIIEMVLPELGRFGDGEADATAVVEEIAEEAQAQQPNPRKVQRLFGKLLQLGEKHGLPIFVTAVKHKLQQHGNLPSSPAPVLPPGALMRRLGSNPDNGLEDGPHA